MHITLDQFPTDVLERWALALLSDQYRQGRWVLKSKNPDANGGGFCHCCLGVLCDLAVQDGVGSWKDISDTEYEKNGLSSANVFAIDGGTTDVPKRRLSDVVPPPEVFGYFIPGLTDNDDFRLELASDLPTLNVHVRHDDYRALTDLNDGTERVQPYSFKRIAQLMLDIVAKRKADETKAPHPPEV